MRVTVRSAAAALYLMGAASAAAAQPAAEERHPAMKRLSDCRSIADSSARLACFDREVASIEAAEARRDLVVMDRERIRNTRRSLFGLALPNLGIFGDGRDGAGAVTNIEGNIKTVSRNALGRWIFDLQEGGRWIQVDSRELPIDPRPGHSIKIRRASLGTYLANVKNQIAIRVERVR